MKEKDELEFEAETKDKAQAFYNRIMSMPEPEGLFGEGKNVLTKDEEKLYKKTPKGKKNLIIRDGIGMMCNCGHGKLFHILKTTGWGWHTDSDLVCKKCKCDGFNKKRD